MLEPEPGSAPLRTQPEEGHDRPGGRGGGCGVDCGDGQPEADDQEVPDHDPVVHHGHDDDVRSLAPVELGDDGGDDPCQEERGAPGSGRSHGGVQLDLKFVRRKGDCHGKVWSFFRRPE